MCISHSLFKNDTFQLLSRRGIAVVSINQFIRVFARSQLWIFLPLYLYFSRGVPYVDIGVVLFIMAVFSMPFTLYGGRFIDKRGAKVVILISNFALVLILLALTFLVAYSQPLDYIYIALILTEPFMNIIGSADNVIVSEYTSSSQRTAAFSLVRIFQNAGFSVGPALGGFIANISYSWVFVIATAFSIAELLIYIAFLKQRILTREEREKAEGIKFYAAFYNRNFLMLSSLIALFFIIMGQWGTTLTLFWKGFDGMTNVEVGLLYSVNGIVVTLGQIPTNMIFKRFSDLTRINIGYLFYLVSFSFLPFFQGFLFLMIDTIFITIGENVITPSLNSVISRVSPPESRGQYFTSFQVLIGLVAPTAPVFGTILLTIYSNNMGMIWYPFTIVGTIFFLSFIPVWRKIKIAEN